MRELLGQPWPRISVRVDSFRVNQSKSLSKDAPKFYDLFAIRALAHLNPELAGVSQINFKENIGRYILLRRRIGRILGLPINYFQL